MLVVGRFKLLNYFGRPALPPHLTLLAVKHIAFLATVIVSMFHVLS